MKPPSHLARLSLVLTIVSAILSPAFVGASDSRTTHESLKLSVTTDRPLIPAGKGHQEVVVRVDIEGLPLQKRFKRAPLNLSVVLDRSGSMRGAKIEQARQAAEMLIDQLSPEDVFSLVIYDTDVEVLVPPQRLRGNAESIRRKIRRIEPGGSTALYHGVEAGGRQLTEFFKKERINRVLLLSDGIANVGPSSNREIARLGSRLADEGISVSTIGLGDNYNEDLLTALAEASDANYYYVADVEGLPEVFRKELGELQRVIARRIVLEISFPEGIEPIEILGRQETISNRRSRITFDTLAAEQVREIYLTCRVDPKLVREEARPVASVKLSYDDVESEATAVKLEGHATIRSVENDAVASRAQVREITAEAEIYRNATITEKAIALADAGRSEEAKREIGLQIDRLRVTAASAPDAQEESLNREIQLLKQSQSQITNEGLSKSSRKALQWNAYQRRNAK